MPAAERPRKSLLLECPVTIRAPWIAVEYGRVEVERHCLVFHRVDCLVELPLAAFAAVPMEPGTAATHEAMRLCAENTTTVICGSQGAPRFYAAWLPIQEP